MQDYETQCIDYDRDIIYSMTILFDIQFCSLKSITFEKKNKKYILDIQINVTAANRGRIYIVKNIEEIEKYYLCYSAKYF